jgi:hypothetical protein
LNSVKFLEHIERVFASDDRTPYERKQFARLMLLFKESDNPRDSLGLFPNYAELKDRFVSALNGTDADEIEETFLTLYCHLHGYEAPYTRCERQRMDETGGYWCHAGGVSPILKAGPYIKPESVVGDFGAGNGLQCLLMQKLFPHRKTIQIEISSRMVEVGKELQEWLDIPEERVQWIVGDVLDHDPSEMDFIYLYRPVRPEGQGIRFYRRFASSLIASERRVVIFSIADCLRPFLPDTFKIFYSDGHLTCYG